MSNDLAAVMRALAQNHLTAGQRACLAAEAYDEFAAAAKERQRSKRGLPASERGSAVSVAGRTYRVSAAYVRKARILRLEDSALFERVLAGELNMYQAKALQGGNK